MFVLMCAMQPHFPKASSPESKPGCGAFPVAFSWLTVMLPAVPLQILHLEDNQADAELVRSLLEGEGIACAFTCVATRPDFEAALENGAFDLILSDFSLPQFDGLTALALARLRHPDKPVIFVSGTLGEAAAVEALKQGATDFVLKDQLARLPAAVKRA